MEVDASPDVVVPLPLHGAQPDLALRGLVLLAQFHGIAADEQQITHDFGRNGEPFDEASLLLAVKQHGLKAKFASQPIAFQQKRENLQAGTEQRDKQLALRAPVDGTVQQLAIHTVGGVVTHAQALMAVVPRGDQVEEEATVLNKEIGSVKPGKIATIKVEIFPYTRYGYLTGEVVWVSSDAVQGEKMGLVFSARLRINNSELNIEGVPVRVTPGIGLSANIRASYRSLASFILAPIVAQKYEAAKER